MSIKIKYKGKAFPVQVETLLIPPNTLFAVFDQGGGKESRSECHTYHFEHIGEHHCNPDQKEVLSALTIGIYNIEDKYADYIEDVTTIDNFLRFEGRVVCGNE